MLGRLPSWGALAAGVAAEADFRPAALPLLAPAERPLAGRADFGRQVGFLHSAHRAKESAPAEGANFRSGFLGRGFRRFGAFAFESGDAAVERNVDQERSRKRGQEGGREADHVHERVIKEIDG